MKILGLSFDYHDAAAAIFVDNAIVAAAQEERFSRIKHDSSLPVQAIRFALEQANVSAEQLDYVSFYERPLVKLDRILKTEQSRTPGDLTRFHQIAGRWLVEGRLGVKRRLQESLGIDPARIRFVDHHRAHAASAFYASPFDEAVVITLDGVGEHETATISVGRGTQLEKLSATHYPTSLGLFYSGFTAYLGFEVNEGEFKVMGMAGYGKPRFADEMLRRFVLHDDGTFELHQDWFAFDRSDDTPFLPALSDWLGPPRTAETAFVQINEDGSIHLDERGRHYADVAASIQHCAEEVILHVVSRAMKRTGLRRVCMAGGVALNSLANGRIQRELGAELYVHPAAGDAGGAAGAALAVAHGEAGSPRGPALASAYLGARHDDEACRLALEECGLPYRRFEDPEELVAAAVERLMAQGVIGWLQGRAEWGPRALGSRSILASPIGPDMKRIVNEKVKFREPFRPFAPSVLKERAREFFELPDHVPELSPEHFMLSICRVRPEWHERVPAITHVDGTARVHLVDRATHPLFARLIEAFGERSGIPILLNTSFNLRGEPIVETPQDALSTFSYSNMDSLVLGSYLTTRGR